MKREKSYIRHVLTGYAFIGIWIIGFLVLSLYPLIYSLYLSFNNVNIGAEGITTQFVGFENYYKLFTFDMEFIQNIMRFAKEIIISVPLVIILSIIIAMLLNSKVKGQTVFRAIYFLPVIIISGPLLEIFNNNMAFENMINFKNINILYAIQDSSYGFVISIVIFLVTNIVKILWYTGVPILIFIVGLQKIPKDMYEASYIDGASVWQSFWKLTLPSLVGYIVINIIFTVIQIATMDNQPIIKIISSRMFDLSYGFGYAASIAWVFFIILILVIGIFLGITMLPVMKKGRK